MWIIRDKFLLILEYWGFFPTKKIEAPVETGAVTKTNCL
jgi:hypothetical protein